jgi:hypothetical protein
MQSSLVSAAISGFLLGASLILAIGAQNAFILRQGLLRQHVFILCLICALSDALLIAAGVAGLGTLISTSADHNRHDRRRALSLRLCTLGVSPVYASRSALCCQER